MLEVQNPILVVEDEKEIRELIALHLLRQGYKVTECTSALEAVEEIKKNRFCLIVLDWMLPGMSGLELLGIIKKEHNNLNVLMVTAKTEPEDVVHGLEQGADDYLTKPFSMKELLARVQVLLRRPPLSLSTIIQNSDLNINSLQGSDKAHL